MAKDDALDALRDQLALGAGKVLAEWSLVEAGLAFLFCSILDRSLTPTSPDIVMWHDELPERRMAHTIIGAIIGFDARLDLVSAVISEGDIKTELKEIWPGVATRLRKKYKSRHEAAHFVITNHEQENGSWIPYLTPFASSIGSYSDKKLTLHDLQTKIETFFELRLSLAWFRFELEIERGRETAPPMPEPPLIQRVRRSLESQNQAAH